MSSRFAALLGEVALPTLSFMKAIASDFDAATKTYRFQRVELPRPSLRPHDVLVEVRAFATNPVDFKVAASRAGSAEPVIVGWDFAGVLVEVGVEASGFAVGDEVWGAGDITRPGAYAELVAVDSRLVAKKPRSLSFVEAAALPLTSLTAWEGVVARPGIGLHGASTALIIGGAGGVGSIAIQLLKAKTQARVVATASRPETIAWSKQMGADGTVDHHGNLAEQLLALGIHQVDAVFSTTHSDHHAASINAVLRPFGHLTLIDDPKTFDIVPFKRKAISLHWELMFTKALYGYELESQGRILAEVAELVDVGKVKTTLHTHLPRVTPDHLLEAQRLTTDGQAIGKLVVDGVW